MNTTKVFSRTIDAFNSGYRIISNCGGARSSKTFSTLQLLYIIALSEPNILISVVAEVYPVLKRGVIADLKKILESENNAGVESFNKSDNVITFTNGSRIEFFSADQPSKALGSQREYLFLNEANHIEKEIIDQLMIRTSKTIFIDYNPSNSWYIDELRLRNDFIELHSTYLDNNFLTDEQIREIESKKNDKRFWTVYGLGLFAAGDGVVFPEFEIVDNHEFITPTYGLDLGWQDETALCKVEIAYNTIYIDEVIYKKHLTPDEIVDRMTDIKRNQVIIADSAASQIINYIAKKGYSIKPCKKGPNSIVNGINLMKNYKICVTKRSLNVINELRNYSWDTDINNNYLNIPKGGLDHSIDAIRYAVMYLLDKNTGKYNIR